jgi:Ca2+-transporting ATPase
VYKGFGVDFDALRQSDTYMDPYFRQPFSSERKRMTSMYEGKEEWHGDFVLFCKGASEIVLDGSISTYFRAPGGKTVKLDDKLDATAAAALDGAKEGETMREYLLGKVDAMATLGLRTLSIGYRSIDAGALPQGHADSDSRDTILGQALESGSLEAGLIITGVVGIEDPVRQGVPEAVAQCKNAGIRVRMVTGDNRKTAESIARQCGILTEGGRVILGKEFRAMTEEQRLEALPTLDVMARSSPSDKTLMVRGLQALGETVSVTGDGTNDAPALMAADIGLSMGITGTEVAKEASKIVITDDQFTSIVTAVKWGRSVLKNIRSFLQFQLTINIVALSVTFVVATTNNGDTSNFPINPVQLLWINLIMDSFAALALATEPPDDHLLNEKPVRREDPLITNYMWRNMIGHSIIQTAILLWMSLDKSGAEVFMIDSEKHFQDSTHYTAVFNAFVWLQIFNKFNARKLRNELNVFEGLFDSYISVGVILIIIAGQVFIVEVGGDITSTVGLTWQAWLISIAIGAISLPVGFLLKFIEPPQMDCPNLFACFPGAGGNDSEDEEATPKPVGAWSAKADDGGAVLATEDAAAAAASESEDASKLVDP